MANALLSRIPCATCKEDTIHKVGGACVRCGTIPVSNRDLRYDHFQKSVDTHGFKRATFIAAENRKKVDQARRSDQRRRGVRSKDLPSWEP